jgi:serine/threonine protein kinase/Tfp pilus assembly protein PilF
MIGETIFQYKILEKIGSGGMGEVYLAEDTKLNRRVALKFLPVHFASDKAFKTRFINEAQAAAKLNHPNIITIHEVSEYDGRPFFVMEYLKGSPLSEIIEKGGLPSDQAVDIILQICEGLKEAHEAGIIHRDIKPSNIIMDKKGRCKILDFGLAAVQSEERLTKTGSLLGTVEYMSPEQVRGEKVDHRSDMFSLGILFFELLTGELPFKSDHGPLAVYSILNESPKRLAGHKSDIPEELQQIVDKALVKDSDGRYLTINDLMEDLRLFRSGQDVLHAPKAGAAERRPRVTSLAVLYLKNLGAAEDEYLSYGITEDLIVDLTRIGSMRVSPMRSIMKYRDSDEEIEDIAKKLDVSIVLDGSIHRSEKAMRISAELIDVTTRKNLWANRWEEPLDNLPQIKQFLAQGISRALEVGSSVVKAAQVGKPEAQDPQAYEYYLRGKYAFEHKKDTADLEVALGLYRQALTLEPSLLAARAGVAEILIHKGEYEQANPDLISALADARKRRLRANEATILLLLAKCHSQQCYWDEAKEYANQARHIRKELHDLAGEANALGMLIIVLRQRAEFDEALALFERVFEINRKLDDQQKVAESISAMGVVYHHMSEYGQAQSLYEEALAIARRRNDISLEAACLYYIGNTRLAMGDLDKPLHYYEQALKIATQLSDQAQEASFLNNIAWIHFARGAYRKAIKIFEKAAALHGELGNRANYALSHNNTARGLIMLGEYKRAIDISHEAFVIASELNFPFVISLANHNLGVAYFYKGENEQAKEYFGVALKASEQPGLLRIFAFSCFHLGELHYFHNDHDLCREYLKRVLSIAEETGLKELCIRASAYLSGLMIREGQFNTGVKRLRKILHDAKDYGDQEYILVAQRLLGQALLEHGPIGSNHDEGWTILEDALAHAKGIEIAHEIKWIGETLERNRMKR